RISREKGIILEIADQHKFDVGTLPRDRFERLNKSRQILVGTNSANVKQERICLAQTVTLKCFRRFVSCFQNPEIRPSALGNYSNLRFLNIVVVRDLPS